MTYITNLPTSTVHDEYTASGMLVPAADTRSREIAEQAARWLAFAEDRTRMKHHTLVAKVLSAVAFSVQHGASSLAVPSKLTGTGAHQSALWAMVRGAVPAWTELSLDDTGNGLVVVYSDDVLGEVQRKHLPWVRPLVPSGLTVHLARVTGHDYEAYTLGCNVVFGHVGEALEGILSASGTGDGACGVSEMTATASPDLDVHANHGAAQGPMLALSEAAQTPLRLVVRPEHDVVRPGADPQDIVLYRRVDGTACASVEHVVRHSPTGIEWGRMGSGPADLALSVLAAFCEAPTAERLYGAFETEVVARVPYAGGVLRAADVRVWAASQSA